MNAVSLYRAQQLAIAAAIDSGDYGRASDLLRRNVREFARTPERTGTTGHNRTLTAPTKCGIIKVMIRRYMRRKKQQEVKKMKKMYIESDNGGRSVMLRTGNKWYVCDCSPSGYFGPVDILSGTEEEAAKRMRKAIDAGEIYNENDCAENLDTFRYIPDYTGLTSEQIESRENDGRSCDYMRMVEI